MSESDTDLPGTAYHEAGHAVCAVLLGVGFESVSIVPCGDRKGEFRQEQLPPWFPPLDIDENVEALDRLAAHTISRLAGPAAKLIASQQWSEETEERQKTWARSEDIGIAEALACSAFRGDQQLALAYRQAANRCAMSILHNNWPAVKAVAGALMQRKELGSEKVREIIEGVYPDAEDRVSGNTGERLFQVSRRAAGGQRSDRAPEQD